MAKVKVGCCGFSRGMKDYFKQFKLVEIQQTFYKLPKLDTALKWRQLAPPDFEFTLKASQLITHPVTSPTYRRAKLNIPLEKEGHYGLFKPTDEVRQAWAETKRFARALEAKVIIFQCPPSFSETSENVVNLGKFSNLRTPQDFFWSGSRGENGVTTLSRHCALNSVSFTVPILSTKSRCMANNSIIVCTAGPVIGIAIRKKN